MGNIPPYCLPVIAFCVGGARTHAWNKTLLAAIVKFYFSEENSAVVATRLQKAGERNASVVQK